MLFRYSKFLKLGVLFIITNLNDDEQAYPSTHLGRISIHASHNIYNGLSNGDDHSKHCKRTEKKIISSGNITSRDAAKQTLPKNSTE